MMLKNVTKKHMLSVIFASVAALGFAANANAAISGPYIGGQLGYGNVHQDGFSNSQITNSIGGTIASSSKSTKNGGLAGRVFGGYQFNQNFAAEMGYAKFSNTTAKASALSQAPTYSLTEKSTDKTYAVDLVGKAILPLQYGFNVFGKAGIAYLNSSNDTSKTVALRGFGTNVTTTKSSSSAHHIYPTFGAGVGYDVTQNLVADVSWNRIQKTGKANGLASTDLFAAGLAYNFG